jgi:hypothetical protein
VFFRYFGFSRWRFRGCGVFVVLVYRYFGEGFVGVWEFLCRGVHIVVVLFGVGWWVLYLCGAVVLMVNLVVMNNHIGLWRLKFLGLVIIGLILG